ncbi:hypothetical protein, partial [Streptococcus pneumoniae]|uniref:hypothetical protein n=1 Tax=Streptococcus pneumoniae TaxID=1313 RepID=UPI0018E305EC
MPHDWNPAARALRARHAGRAVLAIEPDAHTAIVALTPRPAAGRHRLDMASGAVVLQPAGREAVLQFDGHTLRAPFGPAWRLLMIGAGQLSRYVADLAHGLGFEVLICDPREGYA